MPRVSILVRCVAFAALLAVAGCGDSARARQRPPHKLLVVGWDGATFQMIDPLLAAGRLPNLAKLIERGSSARLESTKVPISSAAWVGAVTGKTPGQNGVYSFFEPIDKSYDVRLISARSNHATPIWRTLTWHGMKSLVFNVPVTYPPEHIDGTMVGCMLSPFDADYSYPAGVTEKLRARGFVPDLGQWREHQEVTFERVEQQLALKRDILVEMLRGDEWDFAMVVFKDLDVWCHKAYDADPAGTIGRHYELLDGVLGELIAAAPQDANVIVLSDHGFETYHKSFVVQRWLVEHGFAVERADDGPETGEATHNLAERRALDYQQMLASLDLDRSVAFGGACEGNYGGVRLNVVGREPHGALPKEQVSAKLDEISHALLATKLPGTDRALVTRTFRASELYPGPYSGLLPDLIFELDPAVAARAENLPVSYGEHERIYPDHHLTGVFFAAGPAFAHRERGDVAIFDLAPTALHVLGLPVYAEMQGVVRREMLVDASNIRVVREADDPAARDARKPRFVEPAGGAGDEVESRLRGLGYTR
jgi:predicted AlkP superfamily phosphohydrolase/phosphomutase